MKRIRSALAYLLPEKQYSEHQHQAALVHWAQRTKLDRAEDIAPGATIGDYLFAVPNGMPLVSRLAGKRLVDEGMKKGVADLFLPIMRGGCGGMWIEMKAPGKRPRPEQNQWLQRMANAGYCAIWADDWDSAREQITLYLQDSQ